MSPKPSRNTAAFLFNDAQREIWRVEHVLVSGSPKRQKIDETSKTASTTGTFVVTPNRIPPKTCD